MKHLVFKTVLYSSNKFKGDLQMNALRTLHPIMRSPGFGKKAVGELGLTNATFNNLATDLVDLFNELLKAEDWAPFVNICAVTTAFIDAFPDRCPEFKSIIKDLVYVVKEKTEVVRKNAAVLVAKLSSHEGCKEEIRAHHGMEVLYSLKGALTGK